MSFGTQLICLCVLMSVYGTPERFTSSWNDSQSLQSSLTVIQSLLWYICECVKSVVSYADTYGIGFSELDESVIVLVSQCGCLPNSVSASPWVIWPVISWIMCSSSDKRHQKHCLHAIQLQTQMLQVCMYSPKPNVSFHPRWSVLGNLNVIVALKQPSTIRSV